MNMPNKTIYVKDEGFWNRAKELAGKGGLSDLIERTLREFVEREGHGFTLRVIRILGQREVRFYGRLLFEAPLDDPMFESDSHHSEHRAFGQVFQTKSGKLVAAVRDESKDRLDGEVIRSYRGYWKYESFDEFAKNSDFFNVICAHTGSQLEKEADGSVPLDVLEEVRNEFRDGVARELGTDHLVWIE
jgi:hypothetical protein